jgi:thymidylate kinase
MIGRIIALSGAHGTGKTTAAYKLAAHLKCKVRGEVGLILEVARRCPYKVLTRDHATERAAQMWIFAEQIRRELDMVLQYDWVVSDRTIVDCIAYSSISGFHELAAAQLAVARHHVGIYHRVMFRCADQFNCLMDDGFRDTDPTAQMWVQSRMLELYLKLDINILYKSGGGKL